MKLLKGLPELSGLAVVKIKEDDNSTDHLEAYAMDEDYRTSYKKSGIKKVGKSIRETAGGMGGYHSCDYFYVVETEDKTIKGYLIEKTDLVSSISERNEKYMENVETRVRNNFFSEYVEDWLVLENRCKLYSSLLIMCRFLSQFQKKNKLWEKIEFNFVLLLSNEEDASGPSASTYTNVGIKIKNNLKGIRIELVEKKAIHSYNNFKDHIKSLSVSR